MGWQKELVDAINRKFPSAAKESLQRHNYVIVHQSKKPAFDYHKLWINPKLMYLIDGYDWQWVIPHESREAGIYVYKKW